jgi:ribosomal protein S18 acetylase RimI-like enzyme
MSYAATAAYTIGAMNTALRSASAADADAIANLHAESWRATYRGAYPDAYLDGPVFEDRRSVWRERLAHPPTNQHVIVVVGDDVIVADPTIVGPPVLGFICVLGDDDSAYGSYIDNLHVAPHLKRSGIGIQLMREAAAWLVAGYPSLGVYLGVSKTNENARRFYEALGARDDGCIEKPTPAGGTSPVHRYTWPDPLTLLKACER